MVVGVEFQECLDKERERQRDADKSDVSCFLSLPPLSSSHLAPQWCHALWQLTPVRVVQQEHREGEKGRAGANFSLPIVLITRPLAWLVRGSEYSLATLLTSC